MTLIKWLRTNGRTAYWLAKQMEVDAAHIGKICKRQASPSLELANRITKLTKGEVTAPELEKQAVENV